MNNKIKSSIKKIVKPLLPLMGYLLFSIILTYPLITKFFTHIPGVEGDSHIYLYSQWWLKKSLMNSFNFFDSPLLLHPFGADLSFSATTISNNLIVSFFDIFLPTITSFNLLILLSFVFSAWGMYLLLQYLIKNKLASFFGGFIFSFHPYIFNALWSGHYNYSTVYFIPFFILFLLKATQEKSRKYLNAFLAALFLLISFYNDFYYTFGLLFIFVIYFFWLWYKRKRKIVCDIKIFLMVMVIFILFALPLGWRVFEASVSGDYPFASIKQISFYSPDIRSFFIPAHLNTFFGDYTRPYYQSMDLHNSIIYIGYLLIFLTILGYYNNYYKKEKNISLGFWLILSIFFFFVTLGPILFFAGKDIMPLPYQILYLLPFLKGVLVPSRFFIFLILSLVVPATYGLSILINKLKYPIYKKLFVIMFTGLLLFEYSSFPIPLSDINIPKFYHKLSVDKSDYAILQLPFALSTSFYTLGDIKSSSKLEYYQSIHEKPILGGYVSRVPNHLYKYYNNLTGLKYVISPSTPLNKKDIDLEKQQVIETFSALKIGYIIIHPEYYVSLGYNKHEELVNTLSYFDRIYGNHYLEDQLLIYDIRSYIE